jgi:phosphate uptake regulator
VDFHEIRVFVSYFFDIYIGGRICFCSAQTVSERIKEDPEYTYVLLQYIYISRRLERIADHATNIAEDVIYLVRGDIVRHSEEV